MAQLSVSEVAAINRIAAALEKHVSNGIIDAVVAEWFTGRLDELSKVKKIRALLHNLLTDGRAKPTAAKAIAMLSTEAHQRTLLGTAELSVEDMDQVVQDMRTLGLAPRAIGTAARSARNTPGRLSNGWSRTGTRSARGSRSRGCSLRHPSRGQSR